MDKIAKYNIHKFINHKNQPENVDINGVNYRFIGMGGQGLVYKTDNIAIKIFKKRLNRKIVDELVFMKMCRYALDKRYTPNLIRQYDVQYINDNVAVSMEHLDGTLNVWAQQRRSDELWRSMLFQLIHVTYVMNNTLFIQHNDMKPKNIMFTVLDKPQIYRYTVRGKSYYVPIKYLFKIIDFGHSKYDPEKKIVEIPSDLKQIFILHNRQIVNEMVNKKSIDELSKIASRSKSYAAVAEKDRAYIEKTFKKFPQKVVDKMRAKAIAYFIVENNMYDKKEYSNIIPGEEISDAMERFKKMNFLDLFSDKLFNPYLEEKSYDSEYVVN